MTITAHTIARVFHLTPLENCRIERKRCQWHLLGCKEGDQPLPFTEAARTVQEAIDSIAAWYAPEIDTLLALDRDK